jgi:hypothetical protein
MRLSDLARVAAGAILAPPLAALAFLVLSGVLQHGLAALEFMGTVALYALTPYTWLIAGLPGLVVGIVNAIAARLTRAEVVRLLLALPVGAIPFLLLVGWLTQDQETGAYNAPDLAALGLAGAFASLICVALVESFAPARKAL